MTSPTCLARLWITFVAALGQDEPLAAKWIHGSASSAIEWVEVLDEPASAVVVGYADGGIDVLDPRSGAKRGATTIRMSPGVRLAEACSAAAGRDPAAPSRTDAAASQPSTPRRAYVFDRFTLASIDTDRGVELWRAGDPPPQSALRGDPEFTQAIAAAAATPTGVAVLRTNGELGLLGRDAGEVAWRARAACGAEPRLHVRARMIYVVSQTVQGTDLTTIDTTGNAPRTRNTEVSGVRADWSATWRGGVLLASTQSLASVADDGGVTRMEPAGDDFLISSLRVVRVREHGDVVIAQRRDRTVEAVNAETMRALWRFVPPRAAETQPASSGAEGGVAVANGDYVVVADGGEVLILSTTGGQVVQRTSRAAPTRIRAAGIFHDELRLAFDGDSGGAAGMRMSVSRPRRATTAPGAAESGRAGERRVLRLAGLEESPLSARFTDDVLLIHTPHRLAAFSTSALGTSAGVSTDP